MYVELLAENGEEFLVENDNLKEIIGDITTAKLPISIALLIQDGVVVSRKQFIDTRIVDTHVFYMFLCTYCLYFAFRALTLLVGW